METVEAISAFNKAGINKDISYIIANTKTDNKLIGNSIKFTIIKNEYNIDECIVQAIITKKKKFEIQTRVFKDEHDLLWFIDNISRFEIDLQANKRDILDKIDKIQYIINKSKAGCNRKQRSFLDELKIDVCFKVFRIDYNIVKRLKNNLLSIKSLIKNKSEKHLNKSLEIVDQSLSLLKLLDKSEDRNDK